MLDRIESVVGIESIYDALLKLNPLDPNMGVKPPEAYGAEIAGGLVNAVTGQNKEKKKELDAANREQREAEEALATAEEQTANQPAPLPPEQPGGPREDTGIIGMKNPDSTAPTSEGETDPPPQSELPPIGLTRSWFVDNFGMTSAEISELLVKAQRMDVIEAIEPILIQERKEVIKQFPGVDPNLIHELPLTDRDYEQLNKNAERFGLYFRQLVKSWEGGDDDEKTKAIERFHSRIDKSQRLSYREQDILEKTSKVLTERGPMNAQTLKSYGVSAPSKEIAKLIRSHGFLFDIIKAGQGKKADDRCLFYDVERPDVLIKNCGRFIGSLLDGGGSLSLNSQGIPRISMPFSSVNAPAYADAIKAEMSVNNVMAEGSWLIIEGEPAVEKALQWSIPSMNEKSDEATILLKSIQGDERAQRVLVFTNSDEKKQVDLLKKWNCSNEAIDSLAKEVVADGE